MSFVYLGPKLWNTMPLELKNAILLLDFKDTQDMGWTLWLL